MLDTFEGQVYVLVSRCTDCANFHLVGVPPKDLVLLVEEAWRAAGMNVDECWEKACSVTGEWIYDPSSPLHLQQKHLEERTVPIKHKTLAETLDPQPQASVVIRDLLEWISRVDYASQRGEPRPLFQTLDGRDIFPPESEQWWLTDVSKRKQAEADRADSDGPPSDVDEKAPDVPTDDDDPLSEIDAPKEEPRGVSGYRPKIWWRQ